MLRVQHVFALLRSHVESSTCRGEFFPELRCVGQTAQSLPHESQILESLGVQSGNEGFLDGVRSIVQFGERGLDSLRTSNCVFAHTTPAFNSVDILSIRDP